VKQKTDIKAIPKITESFLEKTYLMIGPVLEEIDAIVVSSLVKTLNDERYSYKFEHIAKNILFHIEQMCSGPTDLLDQEMVKTNEKERHTLEQKSITLENLYQIINENRHAVQTEPLIRVSKTLTFRYQIRGNYPSQKQLNHIHQLMEEYWSFDEGDEKQYNYLERFEDMSKKLKLYNDPKFLEFLNRLLKKSGDKHIILACLYTLHRMIMMSKIEKSKDFIGYVYREYFQLFKKALEVRDPRFEYSLFKIQHIFEELKDLIALDQLCEMYWYRMIKVIKDMKVTGLTDNSLWNCIVNLNKCEIKPEWHKWLIKKDKYSSIKDPVIRELENF